MANNLKSMITVNGNEEVLKYVDSFIDKVHTNVDSGDSDITGFAKGFYDDVDVAENGGVLNTWSIDNLGSKWTYLYDNFGDGDFSIESAWYPPKQFFIHLYNLCVKLDENVSIDVMYEDETYDPVGAIVVKKDRDGTPCIHQEEDTSLEDPTVDMDWEDEDYDEAQMNFSEEVYETQQSLLETCNNLIESDGFPIEDYND